MKKVNLTNSQAMAIRIWVSLCQDESDLYSDMFDELEIENQTWYNEIKNILENIEYGILPKK